MRRLPLMRVTAGALLVMALLAGTGANQAAAQQSCDRSGQAGFGSGTAGVGAIERCSDHPGPTPGSSASEEDRWNSYCSGLGPYGDGYSVSITQGSQVTGSAVVYQTGSSAMSAPFRSNGSRSRPESTISSIRSASARRRG